MFLFLTTQPVAEKTVESPPLSWLQFVDNTIGHLAWPIIVLIIIMLVHPHLKALVDRILEFSFGGATVKFGQFLTQGTDIVDEAAKEDTRIAPQLSSRRFISNGPRLVAAGPEDFGIAVLPEARAGQPVHNIFAAFAEVEEWLENIGAALKIKARNGALMGMLLKRGLLSQDCMEVYDNLRLARNAVAHGRAAMPTVAEGLEYVRQANFLNDKLAHVSGKLVPEKKEPPEEAAP
jgi:hypothetical protein